MAIDDGGGSAGGTSRGLVGVLGKATAVVIGLTALIAAIEILLTTGQPLTCRLGVDFPWCETIPQECSLELPLEEYLECSQ